MKRERIMIVLSMISNTLQSLLKVFGGMVFGSFTLMVSGYYTLFDIAIDFINYITSVIRGRRINPKEPFGYGRKECFFHSLIAVVILCLSIFILIKSFFLDYRTPDGQIIFVILILILINYLNYTNLFKSSKENQSIMLTSICNNSFMDFLICIVTLFFVVLSKLMPVFDLLGVIFIALLILIKSIKAINDDLYLIKGENLNNAKMKSNIKKIVNNYDNITFSNAFFTKVKENYKVDVEITISNKITFYKLWLDKYLLINDIKNSNSNIKSVEFSILEK